MGHVERDSLEDRGPVDLVLALALVHHLAISNNVPLDEIASYFSKLCNHLIIEFVPKEDSQVKILLSTRKDVFPDYHLEGLAESFNTHFIELKRIPIDGSERTLFLFESRRRPGS